MDQAEQLETLLVTLMMFVVERAISNTDSENGEKFIHAWSNYAKQEQNTGFESRILFWRRLYVGLV